MDSKTIYFDDKCEFCLFVASFLHKLDNNNKLSFSPLSSRPELGTDSVVYVSDRSIYQSYAAVAHLLAELYPFMARFALYTSRNRYFLSIGNLVYKWVAKNRKFVFKIIPSKFKDISVIDTLDINNTSGGIQLKCRC